MGRFSGLEEGFYKAVIKDWNMGKASTGTPQLAIVCTLLAWKDDAGNWIECDEEPIRTVYAYLTDGTADRFFANFKHLGIELRDIGTLSKDSDNAVDLEGIKVELHMAHEEYNGKERERWEFSWNHGGGLGMGKPMERKEVAALNAKYADRLKGTGGGASAPAKTAPSATPSSPKKPFKKATPPSGEIPSGDDDGSGIPF